MQPMKQSCFPVIARSSCDEAIHLALQGMDCSAEPVVGRRFADPLAHNDASKHLVFIGYFMGPALKMTKQVMTQEDQRALLRGNFVKPSRNGGRPVRYKAYLA